MRESSLSEVGAIGGRGGDVKSVVSEPLIILVFIFMFMVTYPIQQAYLYPYVNFNYLVNFDFSGMGGVGVVCVGGIIVKCLLSFFSF